MYIRRSLHLPLFRENLGKSSLNSDSKLKSFEEEIQSKRENMEQNSNDLQNQTIDQNARRMRIREYSDPFESQAYTRISAPLAENKTFKIDPHMLQLLPTFYGRFNEEPYDFLEEFTDICMSYNYSGVSQEHLKMRVFSFAL